MRLSEARRILDEGNFPKEDRLMQPHWDMISKKGKEPEDFELHMATLEVATHVMKGDVSPDDAESWMEFASMRDNWDDKENRPVLQLWLDKMNNIEPILRKVRRAKVAQVQSREYTHYIHPGVRGDAPPGEKLQVTTFDERGPVWHTNAKDMKAAVTELAKEYGALKLISVEESLRESVARKIERYLCAS